MSIFCVIYRFMNEYVKVLIKVDPAEFYERAMPEPNTGCLIWAHGKMKCDSDPAFKNFRANRLSWMLHNKRDIPYKMQICHSCDNKQCINPLHLWAGTASENMRDKVSKNRHNSQKGWRCITSGF